MKARKTKREKELEQLVRDLSSQLEEVLGIIESGDGVSDMASEDLADCKWLSRRLIERAKTALEV